MLGISLCRMTPNEYCQNKASKSGSSFYYSFIFLPPEKRQAIIALYAFCREVDDVVDECSDEALAHTKLQWWRDEIEATFSGNAQHPVARALDEARQNYDLPMEYFLEIIDGMEMDLHQCEYESFKHLALYCYRVAGVVGLMSAEIFGYKDRDTLKYAEDLGIALQLTNIIRDVREDADRGRIYLPQDELHRFGVSREDILRYKTTASFCKMMKFQADRAKQYYKSALEKLPAIDRYSQMSGLLMAEIYKATLKEIEQDGFKVLEHRTKLTPLRKLWIAYKTSRKEKRLYKKYKSQANQHRP